VDPYVSKMDVKAAMFARPVRGQQQNLRKVLGNRVAPWAAGRAEEQTMDGVQQCYFFGCQGLGLEGVRGRQKINCLGMWHQYIFLAGVGGRKAAR
jgi:hypothetical protein